MKLAAAAAALVLFCAMGSVHAEAVYRCGSTYSQTPCPQGKVVEATDPRSAAQRAEAKRVAASERKLATDMHNDRLADEATQKPAAAVSLGPVKPASVKPGSAAGKGPTKKKRGSAKPEAGTDFVAAGPSSKKKRAGN